MFPIATEAMRESASFGASASTARERETTLRAADERAEVSPEPRYGAAALIDFAGELLEKCGQPVDRARIVAEILVEADLMGHTTHGLQLLAPYLTEIAAGRMPVTGVPTVISDHGSAITWDGHYLPGPWLIVTAMDLAMSRAAQHKIATVVIRRSSHIGCLAAYLKRATDRGLMMILMCSDPTVASVTPHGGLSGRFTPNPMAFGWPTDRDPVLVDISASTTTNGLTARLNREGKGRKLPAAWLVDNAGNASDDPKVLTTSPPGAILPLGGMESGHKGFGLALFVEAMTAALGGFGRADKPGQWGGAIFLQIIDPGGFAGLPGFQREAGWIAEACRTAPVKPGNPAVRLPGERGLKMRTQQLKAGVTLHPEIMPSLKAWALKLGIELPTELA
jgi:LDH2 family malate/lactate/ureidoglycolate dehydrogenase